MACGKEENLSPFMKELLQSFQGGEIAYTEEDLISRTASPPFRVRSSLRALVELGYLTLEEDRYSPTPQVISWLKENASEEKTLS